MIQLLTKLNNNAKVKTEYLGQYNLYHFFWRGGELYCLKVYKSFSYIEQILPLYSEAVFFNNDLFKGRNAHLVSEISITSIQADAGMF